MSKQLKANDNILNLDQNYKSFLKELKDRLRTSQIKAVLAVNKELIKFYWELGSLLNIRSNISGEKSF